MRWRQGTQVEISIDTIRFSDSNGAADLRRRRVSIRWLATRRTLRCLELLLFRFGWLADLLGIFDGEQQEMTEIVTPVVSLSPQIAVPVRAFRQPKRGLRFSKFHRPI